MKKLLVLLLLLPAFSFAGDITIVGGSSGNVRSDSITVRATHVAVDITAEVDEDGLLEQWERLDKFKDRLGILASKRGDMSIKRVASTYNGRGKSSLLGSYGPASSYRMRVFTPLSDRENVIAAIRRLNVFLESAKSSTGLELRTGKYTLAIEDRNLYSEKLLELIKERINKLKQGLGEEFKIKIEDFSDDVRAVQNGEDTIALYYNYELSYHQ
ncbi:MAG: hypothetical protein OIF51_10655 [Cellvibrionaceae bacterium]|nr:hypothetical protein [Cellvibrionaceae bacterium]